MFSVFGEGEVLWEAQEGTQGDCCNIGNWETMCDLGGFPTQKLKGLGEVQMRMRACDARGRQAEFWSLGPEALRVQSSWRVWPPVRGGACECLC